MNWLESQSDMTWFHVPRHWIDVGIGGLYPRGQWPRQADGKTPISTYDAYIAPLAKKVKAAGSTIYTSMKVTEIERDPSGRVTGVKAVDVKGAPHIFSGKNVILAAGGYGANLQMVKKYNNISVIATSNQPGTTGEVLEAAGIDEKGFAQTMKAYNAAAAAQDTKGLSVPKILIGMPVTKAPFYAVPLTTTIHHTMGGLRINEKTQVLDDKGNPIPGLFAAGEITGGIHGGNRLGRNALTDLLVFGHIAGLEVTAHQN